MNKIFGAFTDGANLFWGGLVAIYTHFIGGGPSSFCSSP